MIAIGTTAAFGPEKAREIQPRATPSLRAKSGAKIIAFAGLTIAAMAKPMATNNDTKAITGGTRKNAAPMPPTRAIATKSPTLSKTSAATSGAASLTSVEPGP